MTPEDKEAIEEILETIRLTDRQHELAGFLSHGQKQWFEIGMLLAQKPRILLVDEPVHRGAKVELCANAGGESRRCKRNTTSVIVIAHTKVKINSPGLKVLSVYPYRPSDASCVETRTTSPNCRLPTRPDSDSAKNIGTMLFAGWQSLGNKVESS